MATKKGSGQTYAYSGNVALYVGKLERTTKRFGASDLKWGVGSDEAWVEFRLKGQLYRFDHSMQKAAARGIKLKRGTDAFAQLVLALEDLARLAERGIYELQTWLSGMKALPPVAQVPSFLQYLRFEEIPASLDDVKDRYRTLALDMHPDKGGNPEDWHKLADAMEQATRYYTTTR
ncbi:MAG: J domain-containing protein [Thermaerobacter sp.]|nr:J domain-containing protein [Thermaerobacter sp.]